MVWRNCIGTAYLGWIAKIHCWSAKTHYHFPTPDWSRRLVGTGFVAGVGIGCGAGVAQAAKTRKEIRITVIINGINFLI